MTFTKKLERIGESTPVVSQIIKLQNSWVYPFFVALLCAVAGTNDKSVYIPCMWVFTATMLFAGLFSKDLKVFLIPFIMGTCFVGLDVAPDYFTKTGATATFDLSAIPHILICVALMAAVLIFRLASAGHLKEIVTKKGIFFWGIIFFDVALILNGIFSPQNSVYNLLLGLAFAVIITACYCLFVVVIAHSENGISYTCKILVSLSYAVSFQLITVMYKLYQNNNLLVESWYGDKINREMLSLSWGPPTISAAIISLGIPAALYLAKTGKFSFFSYTSAVLFIPVLFLINTRSAILVGLVALFVGVLICITRGPNRRQNIIYTVLLVALIAFIIFSLLNNENIDIKKLLGAMRFTSSEGISGLSNGRINLWKNGISDFLSSPVFGVGFMDGGYANKIYTNTFRNMYHNIFVQLIGSMGIVGLVTFLIHLKHILEVAIRRFSTNKLLLLGVPLMIISLSLFDNFFFYPNFQIIYVAFLACAEVSLEQSRQKRLDNLKKPRENGKPRVVFTFIEAGKGHVVPTRNVFNAFKEKYGDRTEVVESQFFTETGDPAMQKTEILFTKAVKNQARSPILSILCKIGNTIAGDTFALKVLLSMTISGRKTNPLAVKHVAELDADVIYTAHWSTPYYVNQMKTPRPYVVCFCPDVQSNGAFNVDCNNFLISGDIGYKKVCRSRMYAGGNITKIPFPIRKEVTSLRAESKESIRERLGLDKDAFTVTLSDGGYGMAKMEDTILALSHSDCRMTVIALCGTNDELYERLSQLAKTVSFSLIPMAFTNKVAEYIAASDLYVGKSGANSMAEPASLGVPIIVTKCITYIEKNIKNYYVRTLKGAIYIPSARLAAKKILEFADDPGLLQPYKDRLADISVSDFDATASADLLWERVKEMYGIEE